jgi:hypothetical protein
MRDEIHRILQEMIQKSPLPAKSIAEQVGKPYSTLMRELDPGDRGAKLGVELLLPLMQACNAITPLSYLANAMGYRISCMREISPDKSSFHEELLDTYEALVEYHRAMIEGQPLDIVIERRETLIRQLKEDFVAFTRKCSDEAALAQTELKE